MYSRSYGSIESERKNDGVSIPADYNGSLYPPPTERQEFRKKQEEFSKKEEKTKPLTESIPKPETITPHGTGNGLLEKFSAEDIILFVLVFALLKDDNGDPGVILAVILALLLL